MKEDVVEENKMVEEEKKGDTDNGLYKSSSDDVGINGGDVGIKGVDVQNGGEVKGVLNDADKMKHLK